MKKILFMSIGTISLGLGIIGIMLPVLPTTPFLLLSLACYMRSSKGLYDFIINNEYLGPYVKDYLSGEGIPIKAKKKAISLIWITIGFCILFVADKTLLKIMLFCIASIVSTYIWTRKTKNIQ